MKTLTYLLLLAALSWIVWEYPYLFELWLVGAIGGAYWLFFRKPDDVE